MTLSRKKKIGGVLFTIFVLILMGITLTPALLSEQERGGYGYGYGYGYTSTSSISNDGNPSHQMSFDSVLKGQPFKQKCDG